MYPTQPLGALPSRARCSAVPTYHREKRDTGGVEQRRQRSIAAEPVLAREKPTTARVGLRVHPSAREPRLVVVDDREMARGLLTMATGSGAQAAPAATVCSGRKC
jgi:hypothetical protein